MNRDWIADYLAHTMHLTTEQHGAYLLLLMSAHSTGTIPKSDQKLSSIARLPQARWLEIKDDVLCFFDQEDDFYIQPRRRAEIVAKDLRAQASKKNGKKGGRPKPRNNLDVTQAITQKEPRDNLDHNTEKELKINNLPNKITAKKKPRHNLEITQTITQQEPNYNPEETQINKGKKKPVGAETWASYSREYFARYGVDPVRNQTTNAHISALVKRIGMEEAPHVAAYYVHHNNGLYVAAGHCTNLLLRDAEKLRTEWATGRSVTQVQARQAESRQANLNNHNEAIDILRKKGIDV